MPYQHVPVLLQGVIDYLNPQLGQNFVDATLGGGGYTLALWERIVPSGKILAIDLDDEAIENIKSKVQNPKSKINSKIINQKSIILHHGNFRDIDKIVRAHNFTNISGIVADLGLSSHQLDQAQKGFSFQKREILDMRFDKTSEPDAKFIVNSYDEDRLAKIFREFGEERFSKQVARGIVQSRAKGQELKYTTDLLNIVKAALPKPVKHRANDSARRIFQALRIEANHELENLREFLPKAFNLLKPKGRLAVVSFHSLEDRMVKQYFVGLSKGCVCPPEFPQCICGKNPQGKILTKKPVTASEAEINRNPRSKPAKLRVIEKI